MEDKNPNDEELGKVLDNLEHIASVLRLSAHCLMMVTLVNLATTMAMISVFRVIWRYPSAVIGLIPILAALSAVVIAFRFDGLKRDGDAYFEELSDELHGSKINGESDSNKRPSSLRARVIIRRYSSAASLPLVPGSYGPAILALTNIFISLLSATLFRYPYF